MSAESIDIKISEDGSRVVSRNIQSIGSAATSSSSAVDLLKQALGGLAVAELVQEVTDLADAYTVLQNRLQAVGLEADVLTEVTNRLFQASTDTRTAVDTTATMYSRLAISAKDLGLSQNQLLDFTTELNQAIIVSGATGREAANGMYELSHALASNNLSGRQLRSILMQLPAVADIIAQHMGVTRGQLKDLGTQGKISAKDIIQAFAQARDELSNKFAKTVPTIAQSFTQLHNEFEKVIGDFNKMIGGSSMIADALEFVRNNLKEILAVLASVAVGLFVFVGLPAIISLITSAMSGLFAVMLANPILAIVAALAAAITYLYIYRDEIMVTNDGQTTLGDLGAAAWEKIGDSIDSAWISAKKWFSGLVDSNSETWNQIVGVAQPSLDAISNAWNTFFEGTGTGFEGIVKGYLRVQDTMFAVSIGIFNVVGTLYVDLFNLIREILPLIGQAVLDLGQTILTYLGGFLPDSIKNFFKDVYSWVVDIFNKLVDLVVSVVNKIRVFFGQAITDIVKTSSDALTDFGDSAAGAKFKAYGDKLAKAFNTGFRQEGGVLEGWVADTFQRAAEMGQNRIANTIIKPPPNLNVGGPDTSSPWVDPKLAGQILAAQKAFLSLQERIDPANKSLAEYTKDVTFLKKAQALGAITQQQYNDTMAAAADHYRESVDGIFKEQRAFDALMNTIQQSLAKGIGGFDQNSALGELQSKLPDLFMGTDAAIAAKIRSYMEANRQIGAMAKANLISETSANQMRMQQINLLKQNLIKAYTDAAQYRLNAGVGTFTDTWIAALSKVTSGFTTFTAGTSQIFGNFFSSFTDGFANSVGKAVVESQDLGTALQSVAKNALESLISGFVKLGVQYLVNMAIGQSAAAAGAATATALGVSTATALAAAYAPAAAAVSLASYGANAAPAMAGMTAAYSLADVLSAVKGFASGGYTGNGGIGDIAGLVHGKEYVFDAAATSRIGVDNLEAIRRGQGSPTRGGTGGGAGSGNAPNLTVNNLGTPQQYEVQSWTADDIRLIARDVAKSTVRKDTPHVMAGEFGNPNSRSSKALARGTQTERKRN